MVAMPCQGFVKFVFNGGEIAVQRRASDSADRARALAAAGVTIVAIADVNTAAAGKVGAKYGIGKVYGDVAAMLSGSPEIEAVSVITPNKSEMQEVVGPWSTEEELKDKAQALRQSLHLEAVLVTRSEEGMSLFDQEGDFHVKAQAREVFDVTGAGDTVIATLASLMACGFTIREALPWANKAGGIVVGKFGTASLSFEELIA